MKDTIISGVRQGLPYGAGLSALIALSHQLGYLRERDAQLSAASKPKTRTKGKDIALMRPGEEEDEKTAQDWLKPAARFISPALGALLGYTAVRLPYRQMAIRQMQRDEDDARRDYVRMLKEYSKTASTGLSEHKPGDKSRDPGPLDYLASYAFAVPALSALLSGGATWLATANWLERNRPQPKMPDLIDFTTVRDHSRRAGKRDEEEKTAMDADTVKAVAAGVLVRADEMRKNPVVLGARSVQKVAQELEIELEELPEKSDEQVVTIMIENPELRDEMMKTYLHSCHPEMQGEDDIDTMIEIGLKEAYDAAVLMRQYDKQAQDAVSPWQAVGSPVGVPGMTPREFYALFTSGDSQAQQQMLSFLSQANSPLTQVAMSLQNAETPMPYQTFTEVLSQRPASNLRQGVPAVPRVRAATPTPEEAAEALTPVEPSGARVPPAADGSSVDQNAVAAGVNRTGGVPAPPTLNQATTDPVGQSHSNAAPDPMHADFVQRLRGIKTAAGIKPALMHAILAQIARGTPKSPDLESELMDQIERDIERELSRVDEEYDDAPGQPA